jgi:transposase-like protein
MHVDGRGILWGLNSQPFRRKTMQGKRSVRDLQKEQDWRERVRRWQQSGESVRAFCRREGLQESAFFAWRRELARRQEERPTMKHPAKAAMPVKPIRFVPLEVSTKNTVGDFGGVEILWGEGCVVRVRPGFDRHTLAAVLTVLETRAC